jgi:hypothetical protein
MTPQLTKSIHAKGMTIRTILSSDQNDYISLTDIAKYKSDEPFIVLNNWMRLRSTIEFIGLWEELHNPDFKPIEFDRFKNEAGANAFTLSPQKWIKSTNAIGIQSRSGRYGGTYAHADIAFEFASWISAEFKLYIIKDYQRLKNIESSHLSLDWNVKRAIAKTNYKIHTNAIKEHLIPEQLPVRYQSITYANEADVLNVALFGMTAKEWREAHPEEKGNIRDQASILQLIVLVNLENMNALYIQQKLDQQTRLNLLHKAALQQLNTLSASPNIEKIEKLKP